MPSVLADDPEPLFCRFCKKPVRKDCSAAMPVSVASLTSVLSLAAADALALVAAAEVELAAVPDVVPPRLATRVENALLKVESVLADKFDGAPAALDVALRS